MFNKKGIILHPVTWIVVAFILGVILTVLAAKGVIPVKVCVCP